MKYANSLPHPSSDLPLPLVPSNRPNLRNDQIEIENNPLSDINRTIRHFAQNSSTPSGDIRERRPIIASPSFTLPVRNQSPSNETILHTEQPTSPSSSSSPSSADLSTAQNIGGTPSTSHAELSFRSALNTSLNETSSSNASRFHPSPQQHITAQNETPQQIRLRDRTKIFKPVRYRF